MHWQLPINYGFRKYGTTGGFLLALLAAACQRQPFSKTAAPPIGTTASAPIRALPPVEKGVSEELAVSRKKNIGQVNYDLNLSIPAAKSEPIEVIESLSFNLRDTLDPVQLDFKAPTEKLHSISVNVSPWPSTTAASTSCCPLQH